MRNRRFIAGIRRGGGLLLVWMGALSVASAGGSMEGKVVDRSGRVLVEDEKAVVTLVPIADKSLRSYPAKVKKGVFFIGDIDPGEYRLELASDKLGIDSMRIVTQDGKRKEIARWEGKVQKGMEPVKIGVPRGEMSHFEILITAASPEEIRQAYAQVLLGRVAKALQAGDIPQTEKMLADLLKESPGDPVGLTLRAYVHQQLGRDAEAESDLLQALKAKPDLADALYQLGDIYSRTNRADLALETLGRVRTSDADPLRKAQAAVLMSQIQHSKGNFAEEAANLELARSLSEAVGKEILPQLISVNLDLGKTEEAEALIQQALANGKVDADLEYNLAVAFFNRESYAQASKHFEAAYRSDPKQTEALKNLGICYMKLGDPSKAVERLKTYLETNPKGDDAEQARALIGALEGKK